MSVCPSLSPILWHGNRYDAGNGVIWLMSILLWIGNPYSAGSGLIWLAYGLHAVEPAWYVKQLHGSEIDDPMTFQSAESRTGHPSKDWSYTASTWKTDYIVFILIWDIYIVRPYFSLIVWLSVGSILRSCRIIAKTAMMHQDPPCHQLWDAKDYW